MENIKWNSSLISHIFGFSQFNNFPEQRLLDIEPKAYLEFVQEDSKLWHTTLILSNLQDCQVAYKIKTTSPTLFQVKPCIGVIDPKRSVTIHIKATQPINNDGKISKFQINASQCLEQYDPNTFWKQIDFSQIQQMQLRSRVKYRDDEIMKYQEKIHKLEKELTDWRQTSQSASVQSSKIEIKHLVIAIAICAIGFFFESRIKNQFNLLRNK